jgi:hypothetical protein
MRLLLCAAVVLASGLVVGIFAPRGDAIVSTPGDGCLVVQEGIGTVSITLARGVVFGRFQGGKARIDDLVEGDGQIKVYGATSVKAGNWRVYSGDLVRFRTTGAVKIVVNGTRIELSTVGKGTAVLSASDSAGGFVPQLSGLFSVDAASFCQDNFQQMPAAATRYQISSPIAG